MRPLASFLFALPLLAQSSNPVTDALKGRYSAVKQNLIESAEAMPEDQYVFRLTPQQRPFGEWIGHTAMALDSNCAAMRGVATPPMDHSQHGTSAGKAALVKTFRDSFAACDAAFAEMTDAKLVSPIGEKKTLPVNNAVGLVTLLNSHYGNMVGYLRTKGIVPPSTARTQKK